MKLSEAIPLGAMLSPQAFGRFVDAEGGRCALGAAKAGLTIYGLYRMEMGEPQR
jgi:hypothetical protein